MHWHCIEPFGSCRNHTAVVRCSSLVGHMWPSFYHAACQAHPDTWTQHARARTHARTHAHTRARTHALHILHARTHAHAGGGLCACDVCRDGMGVYEEPHPCALTLYSRPCNRPTPSAYRDQSCEDNATKRADHAVVTLCMQTQ